MQSPHFRGSVDTPSDEKRNYNEKPIFFAHGLSV